MLSLPQIPLMALTPAICLVMIVSYKLGFMIGMRGRIELGAERRLRKRLEEQGIGEVERELEIEAAKVLEERERIREASDRQRQGRS